MDKDLDKLLSYSLDQLDKDEKVKFEKELDINSDLDQELKEMQAIIEVVALAEEPIKPSEQLKQSIIASTNTKTPFYGYIERFKNLFDLDRNVVEELFDKIANQKSTLFESCPIPNTKLFYFDGGPKVAHTTCGIIKVNAGSIFPAHKHQGKEWVLVLQGTATDSAGNEYNPGDIIYSDEKISHSFRANQNQDFIFSVVLEKPNKWLIGQIILDYLFSSKRFKN